MGLYDREYSREDGGGGFRLDGPWSIITHLIVINVVVFILDELFLDHALRNRFMLMPGLFVEHFQVWQVLTYGFLHDGPWHVGINMLVLFFFGREVESLYGRANFLITYLAILVGAGLVTAILQDFQALGMTAPVVGASGAVMGIFTIFVLYFPKRTILIWGILPTPAWALGLLYLVTNVMGVSGSGGQQGVAFATHLAGAALGAMFFALYRRGGTLIPRGWSAPRFRSRPKLRVHDPERNERSLGEKVDEILEKISREGEGSLTKEERRILEDASRRYQRRRQ